jgi:hypothetical protein
MAAILSTDVTVSVATDKRDIAHGAAQKNISIADVTFGDGSLTYPSGGVPLPAIGEFGFQREIQLGLIEEAPANGFHYKFDRENHTIKIFTQGVTTSSTAADANENGALVENSAAAEATVRLPNTVADTTYDLGAMIELPVTIAPAAATLRMLLIGV